MARKEAYKNIVNDVIIDNISESIQGLDFGKVTITVQYSKIIQIDIVQTSNLDDTGLLQEGAGI